MKQKGSTLSLVWDAEVFMLIIFYNLVPSFFNAELKILFDLFILFCIYLTLATKLYNKKYTVKIASPKRKMLIKPTDQWNFFIILEKHMFDVQNFQHL